MTGGLRASGCDIRPARDSDADAIAALVGRAYAKWVDVIGRSPKPMLVDYREAISRHAVFVIDAADRSGLAAVLDLAPESRAMLIENIAVDPSRQGQGLGRRLMAFAEAEARRRSLAEIRLYTNERMVENIAFYKRLGYCETERRPLPAINSTVVYMAKGLPPA
jgi:ribosomal protein S18 acetylase RimI-like enzyme